MQQKTEFPTNDWNINQQRWFKSYNQNKMQQIFDKKTQPAPENLLISFDPEHEQNMLNNNSYFTQKISPTHSLKKYHQKDLSVRSISTSKKPQFFKLAQKSPFEIEHQQTHISEQARHNYEEIQRILKNENNNLKQQNEHLLREIGRLKQVNKKYKETCFGQRIQLQGLKQECEAQKHRADQMKQIIMARLKNLESKALGEQMGSLSDSALGILQGLSLSESGVQQLS